MSVNPARLKHRINNHNKRQQTKQPHISDIKPHKQTSLINPYKNKRLYIKYTFIYIFSIHKENNQNKQPLVWISNQFQNKPNNQLIQTKHNTNNIQIHQTNHNTNHIHTKHKPITNPNKHI